jgi:hypothetical protein
MHDRLPLSTVISLGTDFVDLRQQIALTAGRSRNTSMTGNAETTDEFPIKRKQRASAARLPAIAL